ncbi:MAG: hypothetical protein JKY48_17365 [Flavobacteriales bacterium]|nr:hypothetical protein [Flavobacteriales bacterium]
MERFKGILAFILLAVLSFSFFPIESFHHHEGESSLCNNTETHFDEHAVACDLCDFTLQEYISEELNEKLTDRFLKFKYQETFIPCRNEILFYLPPHRGPPINV